MIPPGHTLPAGHSWHTEEPAGEKKPCSQGEQVVVLEELLNVPARHLEHSWLVVLTKLPALQPEVHAAEPAWEVKSL
jgi:hypothetical protein